MCNFMGYKVNYDELFMLRKIEKKFGTDAALDIVRSGFKYDNWSTIVAINDRTDWEERTMHWEFIPPWVNNMEELKLIRKGYDPKTGKRAIDPKTGKPKPVIPWLNAKAENLLTSPMWKDAARNRRCLVPAFHFYEWRWYKPENQKKDISYPYLVEMKDSQRFLMAGIWTPWTDKTTGETIDTFAIVTTVANDLMQQVHNKKRRQPSILTQELAEAWIFDILTDDDIMAIAKYQLPASEMNAYSLRKDFQSSEDPNIQFDYEELPPLVV
ncbi:MAG TPA: SOS response-associated peptidase [Panacibacter sp.]|nr:SOS response-associated peptidase [Panacibacter sp.]